MAKFKLIIECESTQQESGTRAVVGVFLSKAWFNVLKYWLTNKLEAEGLKVTSFVVTEESKK